MKALHALLTEIVDYAGLFPPATLDMDAAVANYAAYLSHPHREMLGRFVVPVARLDELAVAAAPHLQGMAPPGAGGGARWPLSVLAPPTADAAHRLAAFEHPILRPVAVESKVETPPQVATADAAFAPGLELFFEVPPGAEPEPYAVAVAAAASRCRAKIRTGGVTAALIPDASTVARFLIACADAGAAFKATAGLHHPLRGSYPLTYEANSPSAMMYGYLNVFLAAALLLAGRLDGPRRQELVEEILLETDAEAFTFDAGTAAWRGHRLDLREIEAARNGFARSFGSCSFEEPVDDLAALELL